MSRKSELQKIMNDAREELSDINEKECGSANQNLLGKFFRYSNSYGDGERWWLYAKIMGVKGSTIIAITFQKTSSDIYEVDVNKYWHGPSGWVEVSGDEYYRHWQNFLKELLMLDTDEESV